MPKFKIGDRVKQKNSYEYLATIRFVFAPSTFSPQGYLITFDDGREKICMEDELELAT